MASTKTITLPTGEKLDEDDIDGLLDVYQKCKKFGDKCNVSRQIIARHLGDRTPDSDTRTYHGGFWYANREAARFTRCSTLDIELSFAGEFSFYETRHTESGHKCWYY